MRALLALLLLWPALAWSQIAVPPPCYAWPKGNGTEAVIASSYRGAAICWRCLGRAEPVCYHGPWDVWVGEFERLLPSVLRMSKSELDANVVRWAPRRFDDPAISVTRPLYDEARARAMTMTAFPSEPLTMLGAPPPPRAEVWTVAPNPSSTSTPPSRPTFAWVNGVRSTTAAAERVAVGAACDPKVGRTEGSNNYFGVLGRADRVALCRKQ